MIAAQVIFGDLPEPFLEAALRSVGWVDYIVACCTAPDSHPVAQANWKTISDTVPLEKLRLVGSPDSQTLDFASARNRALGEVPDGDFVLILDADEVHYPDWESISQYYILNGADSVTAAFYHFVVWADAVQEVFPREILFRKTPETQFIGKVHEKLHTTRRNAATADYRYCHYGYLRKQPNVFERWRRYSVIENEPNHYDGQSPEHIIDDRVSVATRFTLEHPPAVRELIEQYPVCPVALQGESEPEPPKVGFVLLVKDDAELLPDCIDSLRRTWGQLEVVVIDIGSSDLSPALIADVAAKPAIPGYVGVTFLPLDTLPGDASLTEALNMGFRYFLGQRYDFIGWVHPDMRFDDPEWLSGLLHELRCWPKVGKVCAANTRDPLPESMIDGHEQAYLIRADVLREIGLFDEGFVGIGGYEDFCMNRRILNAGYRVVITPRSLVLHQGMATRSRRDTTAEQRANATFYANKYGNTDAPV